MDKVIATLGPEAQTRVAADFAGNAAATEHWKLSGTTLTAWKSAYANTDNKATKPEWVTATPAASTEG